MTRPSAEPSRVESPPADGRADDSPGRVARRLGTWMSCWALPGLVVFSLGRDWRAAVTLTLCMALSIVHVRSLQAQVSRLTPDAPLRAGVLSIVRWGFLMLGLLAVLSFGVNRPLALAWGVSLLPLALITEAAISALASRH